MARQPVASFDACHWKGKDLFAAMEKAGDVVGLDVSFRRVIQLWNPALKNGTSRTLVLNLQLLKPGENALSHRHMAGAIRFILKGHGTRLIVEGESFEIGEGDFVTTPSWTWHDHENHGENMMWLDGLDAPLVRLAGNRFSRTRSAQETDRHPARRLHPRHHRPAAPGVDETEFRPTAGLLLQMGRHRKRSRTKSANNRAIPFNGIVLDYANPLNGGPTLPTMNCQIHMLRAGEKTKSHRHTSSDIYHVWRGSGVSYIGDKRFEWEQGDSFVVPLWQNPPP